MRKPRLRAAQMEYDPTIEDDWYSEDEESFGGEDGHNLQSCALNGDGNFQNYALNGLGAMNAVPQAPPPPSLAVQVAKVTAV